MSTNFVYSFIVRESILVVLTQDEDTKESTVFVFKLIDSKSGYLVEPLLQVDLTDPCLLVIQKTLICIHSNEGSNPSIDGYDITNGRPSLKYKMEDPLTPTNSIPDDLNIQNDENGTVFQWENNYSDLCFLHEFETATRQRHVVLSSCYRHVRYVDFAIQD